MIFFCDVNTIWRERFGAALAELRSDVRLLSPRTPFAPDPVATGKHQVIKLHLPRGWATLLAPVSMSLMAWKLRSIARRNNDQISWLIVTSFHYLRLAKKLPEARLIYYCSDDYRSYRHWEGVKNVEYERRMCRSAALSVFVSEALRERAIAEYGLDGATTAVLPNATEGRFATSSVPVPPELSRLPRPIFGSVGVLNSRIDFAFLLRLVEQSRVGSLALVGPVETSCHADARFAALAKHPKVRFFGAKAHDDIHRWMSGLDVGVIPYSDEPINRFCSPMRLYDHLAVGQPILATTHCDQINRRSDVLIATERDFEEQVSRAAQLSHKSRRSHVETWGERALSLNQFMTLRDYGSF